MYYSLAEPMVAFQPIVQNPKMFTKKHIWETAKVVAD